MNTHMNTTTRVGIAGLGTIGKSLVKTLSQGVEGVSLSAVAARDIEGAIDWLADEKISVPVMSIEELEPFCDVVVECAPASVMRQLAEPMLRAGKKVVVLSSGALLDRLDLIELARDCTGQILIPTGALLGLDAVKAAAEGVVHSIKMISRKPVEGFRGAPFLLENNIDIEGITEPKLLFSGEAREAASGFPANLNVAISLSLAGIGPDLTRLEIWADPTITRNTHTIVVDSDSARFSMTIENIPTSNPKTGRITAQSVIALLRGLTSPLRVGT